MKLDVSCEDNWKQVISCIVECHGCLDVLVNNAGIVQHTKLLDISLDERRLINSINMEGVFLGTKYAVDTMRRNLLQVRNFTLMEAFSKK